MQQKKSKNPQYILPIDEGTTSNRAILFDRNLKPKASAQKKFKQFYPASGWVEHDPEEIWKAVVATAKSAIKKSRAKILDIQCIGITNQRETLVIWDRKTGKPIH